MSLVKLFVNDVHDILFELRSKFSGENLDRTEYPFGVSGVKVLELSQ
jgi:hypothetical protein